jgi:hypothetical protein
MIIKKGPVTMEVADPYEDTGKSELVGFENHDSMVGDTTATVGSSNRKEQLTFHSPVSTGSLNGECNEVTHTIVRHDFKRRYARRKYQFFRR